MSTIYTSTPRKYLWGVKDESIRKIPVEEIAVPSHLPWMPILAERGDGLPHISLPGGAVRTYGSRTFGMNNEYQTHQLPYAMAAMEAGNPVMLQRIIPPAAQTALLRISAEVIAADIPNYERTEDGDIVYTTNEYDELTPSIDGTVAGTRIVYHTTIEPWLPDHALSTDGAKHFGTGTVIAGYRPAETTAVDGTLLGNATATTGSTLYPVIDFLISSPGGYGNRVGVRFMLPTSKDVNPLDTASFLSNLAYIWRLGLVEKDKITGFNNPVETALGDLFQDLTIKQGAKTDRTDIDIDLESRFVESYSVDGQGIFPDLVSPFSNVHIYRDNIDTILSTIAVTESTYNATRVGYGSLAIEDGNEMIINFLGGYDENGIRYFSLDTTYSAMFGGVAVTKDSTFFATGGDDGLPTKANGEFDELAITELFDNAVRMQANNFGTSPTIRFQNYAKYPISAIWDSGYSLDTKKALLNILTYRKDVAVVLSTQSLADYETTNVGGVITKTWKWMSDNTEQEELSIAGMLRTYASLYPESEVYGTAVCRVQIIGNTGRIINSPYTRRLPVSYQYLIKVARFLGSPTGIWNGEFAYDLRENNKVDEMRDVSLTWKMENVANQAWANGLTYVEDFDTRRLFFPGIRTVYNNETSVLNSSITMWAICRIERVCHNAWRELTGNSKWSPSKFLDESDRYIEGALSGVFDDRFEIRAETFYTSADVARGYSWSCRVHIYANNMKTVGSYTVVAHRMEDYAADLAA